MRRRSLPVLLRRFGAGRSAVLFLAAWVAIAPPAGAQVVKLGTLAPEGSAWYDIIRDMAASWEQATGGALRVRVYPGGVAGDDPDMVLKMRIGQLQAAALSGTGLYDIAPEVQALQIPMLLGSDDELDHVMDRIAPRLERLMEEKGFKVLNWADAGWVHFFTKSAVVRPEDLRPLRLFVWSGYTAYVEAWKDAGYQPVPLAGTDIHAALQSGLISAVPATPLAALSFQWFALARHITNLRWAPLVAATVITSRAWLAIPADARPALLRAAREAGERSRRETRRLGDEAVAVMKRHGLTVHEVPPEARSEWEESARRGYRRLVGRDVPAELVDEIRRVRDELRATRAPR